MRMSEQNKRTLISSLVSAVICGLVYVVQFDLLFYVPGPVFGFLFSIVNLKKPLHIAIFVVASSIIYVITWNIFATVTANQQSIISRDFGGFLAGLFGVLTLALLTKLLVNMPLKAQDEARTTILGAFAGILFIELMFRGFEVAYLAWPMAFAVWQVSVGWSLSTSVQKPFASQAAQSANP